MARVRERERTATQEELAEDRRRCLEARTSLLRVTIADLRAGLDETQELPLMSMAELVEEGANG